MNEIDVAAGKVLGSRMPIHFPSVPATFVNIPKVGTTSMRHWVQKYYKKDYEVTVRRNERYMVGHLTLEEMESRWGNIGTTFTFVRNPYARLISIFFHMSKTSQQRMDQCKENIRIVGTQVPIESDIKMLGIYKKGFDNWIKGHNPKNVGCDYLNLLCNPIINTQTKHLFGIVPDIIIKIENIKTEFKQIQDLLECDAPMIHRNISKHKPWEEYYSQETKKIVQDWYKADFENFGYDF